MSESYLVVELNRQPVELCKLLKIANLVSGGGEAKIVISEGYVLLNGEVEYQKRKKVYHEDVVEFNGELIQLMINEALSETEFSSEADVKNNTDNQVTSPRISDQKKSHAKNKPKNKAKKNKPDFIPLETTNEHVIQPKKRRPISF